MILILIYFESITDEKVPCLTPYDTIPITQKRPKRRTVPSSQFVSNRNMQLTDRLAKCNISDEQLMKAAAQLVDICKKASPVKSAPTEASSVAVKGKVNRRSNFVASTTSTVAIEKKRPSNAIPMPNFIVTKVTEKKRVPSKDETKSLNQTVPTECSNDTNTIRSFRKQQELAKTKVLVEQQRQKSLDIFNRCNSKVLVETKGYKSVILNQYNPKDGSVAKVEQQNLNNKKSNGDVCHSDHVQVKSSSPDEIKLVVRENKSIESFGKTFRLTKVTALNSKIGNRIENVKPQSMIVMRNPMRSENQPQLKSDHSMRRKQVIDRERSLSVPRIQSNPIQLYEHPTKLIRRNSCFIGGLKTDGAVQQAIRVNEDYSELHDLCFDIISKVASKQSVVYRKRGRPKKRIYKSLTKDLLNSMDFCLKADINKLNEQYYGENNTFLDVTSTVDDDKLMRRSERSELLSIEPVLPSSHQNNGNFFKYTGQTKLSRIKSNNNYSSNNEAFAKSTKLQSLNIEMISSSSSTNLISPTFPDDISQPIDDLFQNALIDSNLDSTDDMIIEYLGDIGEIESPAYEPHTSVSNFDSIYHEYQSTPIKTSTTYKFNQRLHNLNSKTYEFEFVTHDHRNSVEIDDVLTEITIELPAVNISPIRRSSRKRKVPPDFVSLKKKTRR